MAMGQDARCMSACSRPPVVSMGNRLRMAGAAEAAFALLLGLQLNAFKPAGSMRRRS
jgi:hypothetical protein